MTDAKPECRLDFCSEVAAEERWGKRGLCHGHWTQFNRGYEFTPILRTTSERFWSRVEKKDTGCWDWQGSHNGLGYGEIRVNYQKIYAHRFAYEELVGRIPDGLELDHQCHNPPCVNPDHLRPVTHQENMKNRKDKRGI